MELFYDTLAVLRAFLKYSLKTLYNKTLNFSPMEKYLNQRGNVKKAKFSVTMAGDK